MTTGIHAILADLLALAIWLVIMASLLTERSEKRYVRIFLSLIFGALGLFLLARSGEKLLLLARLHSLNVDDVSSASFGERRVEGGGELRALVDTLRTATWATTEHSCQAPAVPVTLSLRSGARRKVWLASNPCARGLAVNLSNPSATGVYHGALYSPTSPTALAEHGLVLPDR